jgi:hypothetical protein
MQLTLPWFFLLGLAADIVKVKNVEGSTFKNSQYLERVLQGQDIQHGKIEKKC